jgi:response regulator RpfG family c-di-GMP phosphodiesterase
MLAEGINNQPRVLYLDSTQAGTTLIAHLLHSRDFELTTTTDSKEATALLEYQTYHVILACLGKRTDEAIAFLSEAQKVQPFAYRALVAPEADIDIALKAINEASVHRFLTKRWSGEAIRDTVLDLVTRAKASIAKAHINRHIERQQEVDTLRRRMTAINQKQNERLLDLLINAQTFRESDARSHSNRASHYAVYLGQHLGLDEPAINVLRIGALLHDVGKLGISDRILLKPGSLSEAEWDEMRWHPSLGFGLLNVFPNLGESRTIVLQHHERWDGDGYPEGLSGQDIHQGARITALADTIDAMSSKRPYRDALDFDTVYDEVLRCNGSQFDPEIVDCFTEIGKKKWKDLVANTTEADLLDNESGIRDAVRFIDLEPNTIWDKEIEGLNNSLASNSMHQA